MLVGFRLRYQSYTRCEGEFHTVIEISAPQNYLRHLDWQQHLWSGIWPLITAEWKVCLIQPASNETPTEGLYDCITIITLFPKLSRSNRSKDGLKACHFAQSSPRDPLWSLSRPKLVQSAVTTSQISPLFLLCVWIKACRESGVWFYSHAMQCAPSLSCTCAQESIQCCLVVSYSYGVKWKHLTNGKKFWEKKIKRKGRKGGKRGKGEFKCIISHMKEINIFTVLPRVRHSKKIQCVSIPLLGARAGSWLA